MKVLFDTDIGTNIDDTLALAYLLKNPECELVGITTSTGQTGKRAAIARELCKTAGQEVPVYPGYEVPLVIGQAQTEVPLFLEKGSAGDSRDVHLDEPAKKAVEFLRTAIRTHPGEITLLTTGPFTNIARLFLLDPEIPSLLKMMVSMGGVYFPEARKARSRETNIMLDPHAAGKVLSMSPEITRIVGLDVTLECFRGREEINALLPGIVFPALSSQLKVWLDKSERVVFHDPLAAVLVFKPDICTWERGEIVVETESGECSVEKWAAGEDKPLPHMIARRVDTAGFFDEYKEKTQDTNCL